MAVEEAGTTQVLRWVRRRPRRYTAWSELHLGRATFGPTGTTTWMEAVGPGVRVNGDAHHVEAIVGLSLAGSTVVTAGLGMEAIGSIIATDRTGLHDPLS